MARMLARAAAGQPTAQGALHLAVAAEVWLRQLEARASWWWKVGGSCGCVRASDLGTVGGHTRG
ncbi:hypothetical protein [Streptomyces sp. NPDC006971]|uniref:hypothetical protein n=1 Tax=Streptomyces sp. NPDC006971 TaxID=3154784 RepID=UPI0033D3C412